MHECPNCRGPCVMRATWAYIETPPEPSDGINQPVPDEPLPDDSPSETASQERLRTPRRRPPVTQAPPPATPNQSESDFGSVLEFTADVQDSMSVLPWWPESCTGLPEGAAAAIGDHCYNSEVELPNGRLGLLVDTGAWGNLTGGAWCSRATAAAARSGRQTTRSALNMPLNVNGVGTGSQRAVERALVPINITDTRGRTTNAKYTHFRLQEYHIQEF